MTLTDPDAPTERTVARYLNQAGALVTITKKPGEPGAETCYSAACAGCLDAMFGTRAALSEPRDWASKHAERCRALPPLSEQDARPE